jgi:hypothetical protein
MPPDPSLWGVPPDAAWAIWRQQQAQRQQNRMLPGGVPDPQPGIPTSGMPVGVKNLNLPQPPKTR